MATITKVTVKITKNDAPFVWESCEDFYFDADHRALEFCEIVKENGIGVVTDYRTVSTSMPRAAYASLFATKEALGNRS